MLKNIIIYLIILLSAFFFCISYFQWFSYFLFIIILLLPVASLLFSLPFMILAVKSGFYSYTQDEVYCGEKIIINTMCKDKKNIFCPIMKINFNLNNQFSNTKNKTKLIFGGFFSEPQSITSKMKMNCGFVEINAKFGRVYDFLGIFFIPFKLDFHKEVAVMPKPDPQTRLPDIEIRQIINYTPKRNGTFCEDYELRKYHNGDSLKNIHWKLSLKSDDLLVREPIEPVYKTFSITLMITNNQNDNDKVLSKFSFICSFLFENNIPFITFVSSRNCSETITNLQDLNIFIKNLYRTPKTDLVDIQTDNLINYVIFSDCEEVKGV